MTKKVLIVDGQVFQSCTWDRGMGKYSFSLLKALIPKEEQLYQEVWVVFTKSRALDPKVKDEILNLSSRLKIVILDLKIPTDSRQSDIRSQESYNKSVLDKWISKTIKRKYTVDFMLLSLFADHSYSVFPTKSNKILLGYDLIPLLYSKRYSIHLNSDSYLSRYKTIFEADIILTISQTVSDSFTIYLGINQDKLCNISGAPIHRKREQARKPKQVRATDYVLMPSGEDLRKNNTRAVQAFEGFRKTHKNKEVRLIITSNFAEKTQRKLLSFSNYIEFVGNVKEEELRWLYDHSAAILFVSEYEGLGLPVLEAVDSGKPIVCSNLNVFNEISTDAFYFVDQLDIASIESGLSSALEGKTWENKKRLYSAILKEFSWENTADRALAGIAKQTEVPRRKRKKRLAVFCPNPEGYSAIGKVVMQMHSELSNNFEVDYYIEEATSQYSGLLNRASYLDRIAKVNKAKEFKPKDYKKYFAVIYHIGNSEYHVETIKNALFMPGIAIIHDTILKGVFNDSIAKSGHLTQERIDYEGKLDQIVKSNKTSYLTSLVNAQRGIIVHSQYAKNAIENISSINPIKVLELPVATPSLIEHKRDKVAHIGLAGILHPVKGISFIEKIAKTKSLSLCKLYVFGFSMLKEKDLNRLKTHTNITLITNISDHEFQTLLAQLDLLINYRTEYYGETSLTVLEAMRYGVVPIVRDIGWYSELPDDLVLKVSNENKLMSLVTDAVQSIDKTRAKGVRCQDFVRTKHTYKGYVEGIEELLGFIYGSKNLKRNPNEKISKLLRRGASKKSIEKMLDRLMLEEK